MEMFFVDIMPLWGSFHISVDISNCPEKCELLRVTNKKSPLDVSYRMQNHNLKQVDTKKYLGVTLQKKLFFLAVFCYFFIPAQLAQDLQSSIQTFLNKFCCSQFQGLYRLFAICIFLAWHKGCMKVMQFMFPGIYFSCSQINFL